MIKYKYRSLTPYITDINVSAAHYFRWKKKPLKKPMCFMKPTIYVLPLMNIYIR